ncbi:hypothetical protein TNCV_2965861 [Trichonephila clavipes]|nr:hypothetical protein TNCV_2965861 [Trichonephila clavipes]
MHTSRNHRNPLRAQQPEGYIDAKRRLCYRSFAKISVFFKRLQKYPHSSHGLTNIIRKFEATGTLGNQPGRGRKRVASQVVDDAATQVEEDISQIIGSASIRRITPSVEQPLSTVHKIIRKVLRYHPYKLSQVQAAITRGPG